MSLNSLPRDWPHRDASTFVKAGGIDWHVQRLGVGPVVFLIHGTAASTHSFRDLASALSGAFSVVMADLPGHGFTGSMYTPTLPRVAQGLGALIRELDVDPVIVAGHSAGAAVAIRMTLDGLMSPEAVVGLAPALKPFGGSAHALAAGFTKLAFLNPVAPRMLSLSATPRRVRRIIARTGSHLDDAGLDYYVRLLQRVEHVEGALRLMANWDLNPLLADISRLSVPVTLLAGETDLATPAADAEEVAKSMPGAHVIRLKGQGHLAHEEDPETAAGIILGLMPDIVSGGQRRAGC